jgi:hypothetical protein
LVSAILKPTLSAEDAEECRIISKKVPALPADTLQPDSENMDGHSKLRIEREQEQAGPDTSRLSPGFTKTKSKEETD